MVTLLNDGRTSVPRIVDHVQQGDGRVVQAFPQRKAESFNEQAVTPHTARTLLRYMDKVVQEGTGRYLQQAGLRAAGKTGTAQTRGNLENQWFVGYAPVHAPRYAFAVIAEDQPVSGRNRALVASRRMLEQLEMADL